MTVQNDIRFTNANDYLYMHERGDIMRISATTLLMLALFAFMATPVLAQDEGDYRTRDSGDWSNAQIWERFNGSSWAAFGTPPDGSETITIVGTEDERDSVFVDTEVSITGRLVNEGEVEANDMLTIADGGVYEHARDAGQIPLAVWAEGSTLEMTGTVATAPDDRGQSYHHVVFNTPDLLSNLNMDLDDDTISGDITVLNTGLARWYLTSNEPNDTSIVTIMGDVTVEDGAFAVQGTSSAQTTFIVHHYGDINVTGGNFSVSRGSQPLGTTTWYIYEGDFSMSNAKTQSSTVTPKGAAFVFAKEGTQTLSLGENIDFSTLPIEVSSGTMLDMGSSTLGGSGHFTVFEGGGVSTTLPGGLAAIFEEVVGEVILEDNTSFEFNGSEAQITSETMPTVVADLVIDNPEGVTLSQETTINGVLRLQAGVFDNTVPFELGPDGQISEEGGSLLIDVGTSSEPDDTLPRSFFVDQSFPNPFNPSTMIRYGLPSASEVTIRVFNMLGQEVRTIAEGHKTAGVHEVVFEAAALSSGLYLYRVEAGDHVVAKPMVLVE